MGREPEARTRVRLCGRLTLEIDGRDLAPAIPGGQPTALLCFLLAAPEHAAERDELIDVLWPSSPPKDPQAALRPVLSRLRAPLAPATLDGRERLRLTLPEPVATDLGEAQTALAAARAAAGDGDWAAVGAHAARAAELLGGGFLPGLDAAWARARRGEVEELELEALEWSARAGLALGGSRLGEAERAGRELVARSPYRESGHRLLMEALAASGNTAEALRAYDDLRVLLREELGAAPAPELQELHGRLLAGEASRNAPVAQPHVPLPAALAPGERTLFVGREAELRGLREAWAAARGGRRRFVVLAGEPGIGKTRLSSEFAREAHAQGTVLHAACREEALVSYQPFVEALRHWARTAGLDPAALNLGPGAPELARLVPELATAGAAAAAGAAPSDPETRRYLLFDAVAELLGVASARRPVLLVLDDLHWADRATLHLLDHLLRAPQDAALLIVGTFRDAEVGAGHPLAALLADLRREHLVERVTLEGLDEPGVAALLAASVGAGVPAGLGAAIHAHTEGNPFFVEEVIRHLVETGVLVERDGHWVSDLSADEIGVPDAVSEVLDRRLAQLTAPCRDALACGAVLGREFSFDLLAAMDVAGEDELIAALEEAVAAQLVVEAGGRHAFTHALVREALHAGLSGPRRQRLHARAAAALEAVEGEAQLAALAGHLRAAGSAGDPAKAIDCSLRAGVQARELSAWDEAAAHWEGALEVMERLGGREAERAALLVRLSELMVLAGDLGREIAFLERALALDERLGDEERAAQAHSRLGMAFSLIDSIFAEHLDLHRAFAHYDAARTVLERGRPRKARGHLEVGVSTALTYALRIPEGAERAALAMELAEQVGDEVLWAGGAEAYGWHRIAGGSIAEGLETLERACEVADRRRRPFLAWMGANIRGQMTWGLGDPDAAQRLFELPLALPYAERSAYRRQIADGIGRCHASRGELGAARDLLSDATPTWITHSLTPLVDLWDGRWEAVEALAERVLVTSRRTGNRWDEWAAHHLAARVHALRGETAQAAERLERALPIVTDGGARYFELWVRPDLARALAGTGRAGEAREHADACLAALDGEDWRGRGGHVALADAVVLAAEERPDDAAARFADARATFARHRLPGEEAETLAAWGHELGDPERIAEAAELLRRHGAGERWVARIGQPGGAA